MFGSYVKIALRSLGKNRLYAAINIIGLAIGLAVYLLATLIADYERGHDHMFKNRDQIYTISSINHPSKKSGTLETRGAHLALQPLIKAQMADVKAARGMNYELLFRSGDKGFYEQAKLIDLEFLDIFDFQTLHGSLLKFTGPNQVILTESMALKFFGKTNAVGEILTTLGDKEFLNLAVVAVIQDVAKDSHFNSTIMGRDQLGILIHMKNIDAINPYIQPDRNWGWMSTNYFTYLMTTNGVTHQQLDERVNALFDKNAPDHEKDLYLKLAVRPLTDANLATWYAIGIPVVDILDYLGLLILLIAIINYANLATAQNMGRFREVGLRKTLGANRKQLLVQFYVECQAIVFIAMLLSLVLLELMIPAFNNSLGKVMVVDHLTNLPLLILTTLATGLIAGAYPAYMISKSSPSEAIRNSLQKGRGGVLFRNVMISLQFVISIIMLAMVLVIHFQNERTTRDSEIFPKAQTMVIQRLANEKLEQKHKLLEERIKSLPDVEMVAFSSQVPFMQQNWGWKVSRDRGSWAEAVESNNMVASANFNRVYNIPILAGRDFDENNSSDMATADRKLAHVVINETAAKAFGYTTPEEAIGQSVFTNSEDPYELFIIGVAEDRNILGLQNHIRPFIIRWRDIFFDNLSIKLKEGSSAQTITRIEEIWKDIYPDYPIDWQFLDAKFEDRFKVMRAAGQIMSGFSLLALSLALFGMFGLAAFMAQRRTREIGIRKVLGATIRQIVPMLLIQFSKPAMISFIVAFPVAYWLAGLYLEIFADRIGFQAVLIIIAGAVSLILAWLTVTSHAIRVARQNPIKALRYE